jgi:hypothetical protein
MKNIHVLPTDKPSRLYKSKITQNISMGPIDISQHGDATYNLIIYITSDEEIKEDDWGLSKLNEVILFGRSYNEKFYKKIILTTDQDLIADGVQAIDDEFLEWFVKNPSCESVVVNFNYKKFRWSELNKSQCYKIIIPQEEPKQETLTYTEAAKKEERIFNSTMMSKQETFEESVNAFKKTDVYINYIKQKQGRMYSEEEVVELLYKRDLYLLNRDEEVELELPNDWFEQFKKK